MRSRMVNCILDKKQSWLLKKKRTSNIDVSFGVKRKTFRYCIDYTNIRSAWPWTLIQPVSFLKHLHKSLRKYAAYDIQFRFFTVLV